MKKVILLLVAIMPLISSCKKEESYITDMKGTKWISYNQGKLYFQYKLYLDENGAGKCDYYNIEYYDNNSKEKLEKTYTVKYEQYGEWITLHFFYTTEKGEEESIATYTLENNKLKFVRYLQKEYPWVDVYDFILVP